MDELEDSRGFDWDSGNREKSWRKHGVSWSECEEVFFNRPLVLSTDSLHSEGENRYFALGRTDRGRRLLVVFAIRGERVRVISARKMTRREQRTYEQQATAES